MHNKQQQISTATLTYVKPGGPTGYVGAIWRLGFGSEVSWLPWRHPLLLLLWWNESMWHFSIFFNLVLFGVIWCWDTQNTRCSIVHELALQIYVKCSTNWSSNSKSTKGKYSLQQSCIWWISLKLTHTESRFWEEITSFKKALWTCLHVELEVNLTILFFYSLKEGCFILFWYPPRILSLDEQSGIASCWLSHHCHYRSVHDGTPFSKRKCLVAIQPFGNQHWSQEQC